MIHLYQQRDFGEKINATFAYAVQQARSLSLCLLTIAGPVTLIAGITSGMHQSNMFGTMGGFGGGSQTNPLAVLQQFFSPTFLLYFAFTFFSYVAVSLTIYSHLKVYAQNQGAPVTVGAVWQEVRASLLGGIGVLLLAAIVAIASTAILALVGVYIGFKGIFVTVLLITLANIYLVVPLAMAMPVFVLEDASINTTFRRCFKIIRNKWWSTFGLLVVMSIIAAIMGLLFGIPSFIVLFLTLAKSGVPSIFVILTKAIGTIGGSLVGGLVPLALGFQYFNLVDEQDGMGLLSAIDSIGAAPPLPRPQDEESY